MVLNGQSRSDGNGTGSSSSAALHGSHPSRRFWQRREAEAAGGADVVSFAKTLKLNFTIVAFEAREREGKEEGRRR